MKKNIWIWNHYATNGFFDQGGRHYWFAKFLLQHGYEPVIFCAATVHNSTKCVDTGGKKHTTDAIDGIRYVFLQTPLYHGNRFARIKNMYAFYRNLLRIYKEVANTLNAPDLILASSVHPLTLIAGIKAAKKLNVPCICEIRDLWPLSLVAYGMIREKSLLARLLYRGEKWIYKKADAIVMTCAGGRQYIIDRGWESEIDLEKVFYVNNGVDLDEFERRQFASTQNDGRSATRKIVYAGSVRLVNNVGYILNLGKALAERGSDLEIVVYGDGDELAMLSERGNREKISNVKFAGNVPKQQIPSVLSEAYMTILHLRDTAVFRYGLSANKLFEYLAAGKPVIQTLQSGYDIITEYACGISFPAVYANGTVPDETMLADEIIALSQDQERYERCAANAKKAACDFDFRRLTEKLIAVIEHTERT